MESYGSLQRRKPVRKRRALQLHYWFISGGLCSSLANEAGLGNCYDFLYMPAFLKSCTNLGCVHSERERERMDWSKLGVKRVHQSSTRCAHACNLMLM
eukprot:1093239-Amphidinium_carterae.1